MSLLGTPLSPGRAFELGLQDARLDAHNQPGFARIYQVDTDSIVTKAIQTPHLHGPLSDHDLASKSLIQINLIRLFQLLVHFDDFLPTPTDRAPPSDRLMAVLERLWDVDFPLGPDAMRALVDHWFDRHVDWWKANRHRKHAIRDAGEGKELLLVNLADEYRGTRRHGIPRRVRLEDLTEDWLPIRQHSAMRVEDHPVEFASRVLQWKQVMLNLPEVVYDRVLPVPPMIADSLYGESKEVLDQLVDYLCQTHAIPDADDPFEPGAFPLLKSKCVWVYEDFDDYAANHDRFQKLEYPRDADLIWANHYHPNIIEVDNDQADDGEMADREQTEDDDDAIDAADTDEEEEASSDRQRRKKRAATVASTIGEAASQDYEASGEEDGGLLTEGNGGSVTAEDDETDSELSSIPDEDDDEEEGEGVQSQDDEGDDAEDEDEPTDSGEDGPDDSDDEDYEE